MLFNLPKIHEMKIFSPLVFSLTFHVYKISAVEVLTVDSKIAKQVLHRAKRSNSDLYRSEKKRAVKMNIYFLK